jgi:hypothetical protein
LRTKSFLQAAAHPFLSRRRLQDSQFPVGDWIRLGAASGSGERQKMLAGIVPIQFLHSRRKLVSLPSDLILGMQLPDQNKISAFSVG